MVESELLFTELLKCSRAQLYLNRQQMLTRDQRLLLTDVLRRRLLSEPIQYILGKTEFMGMEFSLSHKVFIPRPETEILVEAAMRTVRDSKRRIKNILDIGTGSGCIAISLARCLKDVTVTAIDISQGALEVAKHNAILNNAEINFLQSDLFSNSRLVKVGYELIVSNPPYIPTGEIDNLDLGLSYEPRIALDGGRDGLDFYRQIIQLAGSYLIRDGLLILEIGFGQYLKIKQLFSYVERSQIIEVVKDYNNIDRVIIARYG